MNTVSSKEELSCCVINSWMYALIDCSGMELLRNARYNKGLAFTEEERRNHYLTGLLPPAVETQERQVCYDCAPQLHFVILLQSNASLALNLD